MVANWADRSDRVSAYRTGAKQAAAMAGPMAGRLDSSAASLAGRTASPWAGSAAAPRAASRAVSRVVHLAAARVVGLAGCSEFSWAARSVVRSVSASGSTWDSSATPSGTQSGGQTSVASLACALAPHQPARRLPRAAPAPALSVAKPLGRAPLGGATARPARRGAKRPAFGKRRAKSRCNHRLRPAGIVWANVWGQAGCQQVSRSLEVYFALGPLKLGGWGGGSSSSSS